MERIKKISNFLFTNFFERFFTSWFFTSAVYMIFDGGKVQLKETNIITFLIIFSPVYFLISSMDFRCENLLHKLLSVSILFFSIIFLMFNNSIYTFITLAVFFCISIYNSYHKYTLEPYKINDKNTIAIISVICVFFFGIVTSMSVLRYLSYSAPNYDFGIFCNMYYNMKESFSPVTTCERDTLLSHFSVHLSPALYLFLPVYYFFPSPVTIAICQTVAIYSGVIPFILILRKRKIESLNICLFTVVYMANAAFSMGCSYDFHENCLLAPFILWMIYFYEKRKIPFAFLFALLTLTVKEDAFIYVAVFAVFIIISNKDFKIGFPMIAISVLYFIFACWYINTYGLGIMEGRFNTMIYGDEGLFGIIKTVFANLPYSINKILTTSDNTAEKLFYLIYLLFPLGLIPFFTKKPSRLILILPVFLNLLTDYHYQYDIKFQYNFGITALLLYACILNVSDMKYKKRYYSSSIASAFSLMLFFMCVIPMFAGDVNDYVANKEMYNEIDTVLENVDKEAKVCCSTFLLSHLSDREKLYEVHYTQHTDFDFIILDYRPNYKSGSLAFAEKYMELGYTQIDSGCEYVAILVPENK